MIPKYSAGYFRIHNSLTGRNGIELKKKFVKIAQRQYMFNKNFEF